MTPGVRAIRTSVALSRLDHVALVALRGPDAIEVLDRLVPRNLYLRDGEVLQTLFLRPDGTVLADVTAVADAQDYLLLVDGLSAAETTEHLRAQIRDGEEVEIEDTTPTSVRIGVDGPYAWELLVAMLGPEVVGLPYLHAIALDDGAILVRSGKTGEFGYVIIAAPDVAGRLVAELERLGGPFDLAAATAEDLDRCAIENFFFCPRQAGVGGLTLPELQLQWRVSPDKEGYLGAEAVQRVMATPTARRLTYGTAAEQVPAGASVALGAREVGRVLGGQWSATAACQLVWMLLEADSAHPHLDLVAGGHPVRTIAPPLLNNRSLYIDPQRHTYATRQAQDFPELI